MTNQDEERRQVETKIFNLLKKIRDIAYEYCPEDNYFTVSIFGDRITFNNTYWEHPGYGEINFQNNNNVNKDNYSKEEE